MGRIHSPFRDSNQRWGNNGTYIHQVFENMKPKTVHDVREAVVMAGKNVYVLP